MLITLILTFNISAAEQSYNYKMFANLKYEKTNTNDNQETVPDPVSSFDCFNPVNVGQIGTDGACDGKLIVDNSLLLSLVDSNGNYSHNTIWTGQVTDMSYLFDNKAVNYDITGWDVSNVTNMGRLFRRTAFNQNINNWNVSNVTSMIEMFYLSTNFNQSLNSWNVSNVTNMWRIFYRSSFNENISNWNVSNATTMRGMFFQSSFNGNISNWNVSNVTDMFGMFVSSPFNHDISNWCVVNISSKPSSFDTASGFANQTALQPNCGSACN